MIGTGRLSIGGLLSPSSMGASVRLLARGTLQGRSGRHPTVLGATHVIQPGGAVPYAWVNASLEDEAPLPDVLSAVEQAGS